MLYTFYPALWQDLHEKTSENLKYRFRPSCIPLKQYCRRNEDAIDDSRLSALHESSPVVQKLMEHGQRA
jgi:hypothetical protein